MTQFDEGYVWFDGVRVVTGDYGLRCVVNGVEVPLPVAILHHDCVLQDAGDEGRLGVPMTWAVEHGLMAGLRS